MKTISPLTILLMLLPITVSVVKADTNSNQFPPNNVFDSRSFPKPPQQVPYPAMKGRATTPPSRTSPRFLPNAQQRVMPQRMQVPQRRIQSIPYNQSGINRQTSRVRAPTGYFSPKRYNQRPVPTQPNMRNNYPRTNQNSFPFGNNMMPFGNQNNGFNPFSNNSMPFSNGNGMMPANPMKNMFGSNNNTNMPFFPSTNKNRKKAWGTERNIWPDFYTDFTDEAWDTMMSGPRKLGTMPGGWRFPYISTPDPVTVSDAITNQFPPIVEEAGKMADFSDWGIFDK